MHWHFEDVDQVIRLFNDHDAFGSPRYWMANVKYLATDRVRLVGVRKKITPRIREALYQAARERGWKYVEYTEVVDGQFVGKSIEVPQEAAR